MSEDEKKASRLGRRGLVLKFAVLGSAAPALAACVAVPPVGGTGVTDGDPGDPPGMGRGTAYRGTGVTDRDPVDRPGQGRGTVYRTGTTDSDPYDRAGAGRGGYRRGVTDSDPYDRAGAGRRGY